ncbi:TPA: type II CAAX endopeptidase family protein [Bacillus cereus]|jgi:membrane protease YdiL (CAAX protease family)|uniref:CPBP family intramembrane metalloprotease n=2 Tax=Bacillus TaxID=1386 RepID=A0A437SCY8_BACTU|nr:MULTISPECIES: type II CAAX endopeptidase family protein [Bacillus cereus group]AUD21431.1 CPBP family intramembrane metalloprotease [Bacillus sp. HBCD-sjtu]MBG9536152.1 CAAX protease [Bacillus thuringiensis]MCU4761267.1 CPBP family intramembrane metalloprotease [Bacillus cereus]MDH8000047.1 type II CAAX endopeptidase family protein [Bacillus cereus]RVU60982.1 CPBP family intramembrane metalloprotease [Bacillus thuringiensis]
MNREKKLKKPVASFIVLTNIIFLPLFLLVGATSMLGFPVWIFDVMFCISSWSSTFAFVMLFKKIYPGQSVIQFVKDKFRAKLKLSVILTASMIQAFIFLLILFLISKNSEVDSIFTVSSWGILIYFFVKNFLAGPLGEELGWRGFAQIELQKKYSPLKASIIIGFWWGMWHLPIWFTTGFVGMDLIKYILFFMISIISIKIVMTAFYNLNQNLIIPIIIHQFFNFFIGIINGNLINLIMYNAIFYLVVAVVMIVINPKRVLYGAEDINSSNRKY